MAFTATEAELERHAVKVSLGQAEVTANSVDDIELLYWRFDSDTGLRTADEVTAVDYHAIVTERDISIAMVTSEQARLDTLNAVVNYLESLLA